MNSLNRFRYLLGSTLALILIGAAFWFVIGSSIATGSATLSLSPASGSYTIGNTFNVVIHENSGSTSINAVVSDLSYNTSQLEYVSSTISSSFDFSPQNNSVNGLVCIGAGKLGTVGLTNDNTVATVTFRVKAAGTATINFVSGSDGCANGSIGSAIVTQSGTQNIWNGQTSAGSYTLINSTTPPSATPIPGGTSQVIKSTTPTPTKNTGSTNTPSTGSTNSGSTLQPTVAGASSTSYMLAIKVVDSNDQILVGAKVTLDTGQTAVSDARGIASFANVTSGKHTTKTTYKGKTTNGYVEVKGITSMVPQQFVLKVAATSKQTLFTKPVVIALCVLVVLLLVIVLILLRRRGKGDYHFMQGSPEDFTTGVVTGGDNNSPSAINETTPSNLTSNNTQAIGTVFRPTINTATAEPQSPNNDSPQLGN